MADKYKYLRLLHEHYNDQIPEYVEGAGKTWIALRVGEYGSWSRRVVSLRDVIEHYATDARDITSGCRRLGPIVGDWRPVSNLAAECLAWFKRVNASGLKKVAREYGMEYRG